jgi:hypothetical protein
MEAGYDRQRVEEVLNRVRASGGLPLHEKAKGQFHVWLKTLIKRGLTAARLLQDPDAVEETYTPSSAGGIE